MELPKIHFRKVPEDEKKVALRVFLDKKKKGLERYSDEINKNQEELKVINIFNRYLRNEIDECRIIPKVQVDSERIHLISRKRAKSIGMESVVDGIYHSGKDSIDLVKHHKISRLRMYSNLLHEMVHYYSHNEVILSGETKSIETYRLGYKSNNTDDDTIHEHFLGFNEAITEQLVFDILAKYKNELIEALSITEKEIEDFNNGVIYYENERKILEIVLEKMAIFYRTNKDELWNEIKRGYFGGQQMHLRKIEDVFGPGSLRVLSSMSSLGGQKEMDKENLFTLYRTYFEAGSNDIRLKIANKILSERERLAHKLHIEKMNNN